ncbi:MAG: cytochrome bc complex cytochrome b subunit, partial [Deltaproteobacteria bacterium]
MIRKAIDWLDVRLGVRDLWEQNTTGYLVPRNINAWYALGTVLLVLFGLQFLTGILLMIH